jgi:hypothetical protein
VFLFLCGRHDGFTTEHTEKHRGLGGVGKRLHRLAAAATEFRLQLLEVTAEWLEAIFSSLEAVVAVLEALLPRQRGTRMDLEFVSRSVARR